MYNFEVAEVLDGDRSHCASLVAVILEALSSRWVVVVVA